MASYTEHLNLLKKDPVQDGSDTFNIEKMLNENWDKIDEAVGAAESAEDSITKSAEKTEPLADGDAFAILDSEDGTELKRVLWSAVKAALRALFAEKTHVHSADDIGAAAADHQHDASDIDSGTLTADRLPTVPIARGGTGQTTAAAALYALINGAAALAASGLATSDILALGDVSAASGKKVTLANLITFLQGNLGAAKIAAGSYVGTGTYGSDNPCSLTFDFVPKVLMFFDSGGRIRFSRYDANTGHDAPSIADLEALTTEYQNGVFLYSGKSSSVYAKKSGKTISWYDTSDASYQVNASGGQYFWVALG